MVKYRIKVNLTPTIAARLDWINPLELCMYGRSWPAHEYILRLLFVGWERERWVCIVVVQTLGPGLPPAVRSCREKGTFPHVHQNYSAY
jgi:hypothetical protein